MVGVAFWVPDGRPDRDLVVAVGAPPGSPAIPEESPAPIRQALASTQLQDTQTPVVVQEGYLSLPLEVHVSDTIGFPIVGASVALAIGDAEVVACTTDERGVARIGKPITPRLTTLLVKAEGYSHHFEELLRVCGAKLEVVLPPESVISGRVATQSNVRLGLPVRVYAWPVSRPPSEGGDGEGGILGSASIASTIAAPDGTFEIRGLSSARRYSVGAGAAGWATPEAIVGLHPGGPSVTLVMRRLHVVVLRPAAVGGFELPESPFFTMKIGAPQPEEGFVRELWPSVAMRMAGFTRPRALRGEPRFDWRNTVYACFATGNSATVPSATVGYDVPGFEKTRITFTVPPFLVETPTHEFPFRQLPVGIGCVEVRFVGGCDLPEECRTMVAHSSSWIDFTPDPPNDAGFRVPLLYLGRESVVIPSVPQGRYKLRVFACNTAWRFPEGDDGLSVVVSAERQIVEVPVGTLGAARFDFDHPGLDRMKRPLRFVARQADRRPKWAQYFTSGPPHVISDLYPGVYEFEVTAWLADSDAVSTIRVQNVLVESGKATICDLRWPDK